MKSSKKTKAQILTELCKLFEGFHEDMKAFVTVVESPVKKIVKDDKKLYKNHEKMWFLFSDIEDLAEVVRAMTRELQENIKEQNINGPFTRWPDYMTSLMSSYLKYFHNYYAYYSEFQQVRAEEKKFNEKLLQLEEKYGSNSNIFMKKYLRLPHELSDKFNEFTPIITQGYDYSALCTIKNSTAETIQKATASLNDGIPNRRDDFLFMEIKKHECFGTICDTYNTEENKRYKSHIISKISPRSLSQQWQIQITLDATYRCQHPNIMNISHLFEDELFFYIIYPFTEEMELSCILERGGKLPEEAARPIFRQLMHAIQHLHTKGIVHGNITPSKIIIYNNKVKLYDFSCAHFSKQDENLAIIMPVLYYAPPDSFRGNPFNGFAADIWSAGVILFEILTCKKLFKGTEDVLKRKIMKAAIVFPKEFSPLVISLLRGILQPLPGDRLSIEQILSHPWMKKMLEVTVKNVLVATPPVSPSVSPLVTRPVSPKQ